MTLRELIAALPPDDRAVCFDFGGLTPTEVQSYRGYYRDLALGFCEGTYTRCNALRANLDAAIGREFTGYKGGEFTMDGDTRMWVANWGVASDTEIVCVSLLGDYMAVIRTASSLL